MVKHFLERVREFFRSRHVKTSYHGIRIIGTPLFVEKTIAALDLLRSTRHFGLVAHHISTVRPWKCSGFDPWAIGGPTFIVGKKTWQSTPIWYAGAIAHDAYHGKLYLDAKRRNWLRIVWWSDWCGWKREKECCEFQLEVLKELKADNMMIDHLETVAKDPNWYFPRRLFIDW